MEVPVECLVNVKRSLPLELGPGTEIRKEREGAAGEEDLGVGASKETRLLLFSREAVEVLVCRMEGPGSMRARLAGGRAGRSPSGPPSLESRPLNSVETISSSSFSSLRRFPGAFGRDRR